MYHPEIIKRRIEQASQSSGIKPVSRSIEFCRQMIDILGTEPRPLTPDELEFVRSEILLCQCDFLYCAVRYYYITHWKGYPVLFSPNIAQSIVLDVWGEMEQAGLPINIVELKGRQIGVSTLTELAIGHRLQFHPNTHAIVGSSDPKKSRKMSLMMEFAWRNCPWWLTPKMTKHESGEVIEFGGQDCAVYIEHGRRTSLARGSTVSIVHLSELPEYEDPVNQIDSALLRAVHDTPSTFMVFESTAKGRHNWFHKFWLSAKDGWGRGRSRFRPVFLPWFVGSDIWPPPGWLKLFPIPGNWVPSRRTQDHVNKCQLYVSANPLLRKHLGLHWKMPRRQQWYWECEYEENDRKGTLSTFLEEMPSSDTDAFQSSSISVFPTNLRTELRSRIMDPQGVYSIFGSLDEIPGRFHPLACEQAPDIPRIRLSYSPSSHYILVPLRFNGYDDENPDLRFYVWEPPAPRQQYVVSIDIGDGIGQNLTSIQVIRKGDHERNDAQVAELSSAWLSGTDSWPFLLAIGTFYTTRNSDGDLEHPKIVIETNRGEAVQHELFKRGWPNFHIRRRLDRSQMQIGTSLGWLTTYNSRTEMLDFFIKFVKDQWLEINSPWLLDEMSDFGKNEARNRLEALNGAQDDRIFAIGIGLFCLHIDEIRGSEPLSGHTRILNTSDPTYVPDIQALGVSSDWSPEQEEWPWPL